MVKTIVKTNALHGYEQNTISELERIIQELETKQAKTSSRELTATLSTVRHALQLRQRSLKAQVMDFERENHHNLLFFCSTRGFVKLVGHSALFFAMTIADRIHWRYSLKIDTDHYSPSSDGVISFRSLDTIQERLAEINIYLNKTLSNAELFYFDLPKSYSDEQIAKLRDNSQQDIQRIMSIVLPASPVPSLYDAIMQASQLIYYQFKHLSDNLAKESLGNKMITLSYEMSTAYLHYARRKDSDKAPNIKYLLKIIESAQEIRFGIAYASKLQILHHREVCKILEHLVSIERIASKSYLKAKERSLEANELDNNASASKTKNHPTKPQGHSSNV